MEQNKITTVAKRLNVTPKVAKKLLSWSRREARNFYLKSLVSTYYLEHDEWYSIYGIDINYYITDSGLLKIIGYRVDSEGYTDTTNNHSILLSKRKVRAQA